MNRILAFILLLPILSIISCSSYDKEAMERRAKHQAGTGSRINDAQKNTDSLFKEIE